MDRIRTARTPSGAGRSPAPDPHTQPWASIEATADQRFGLRPGKYGHGRTDRLWRILYPDLAGWCLELLGDRGVARDLAGESFVRLFARWRTVRDPRSFLYVTATDRALDLWRSSSVIDSLWPDLVGDLPRRAQTAVLLHAGASLSVPQIGQALHRTQRWVRHTVERHGGT